MTIHATLRAPLAALMLSALSALSACGSLHEQAPDQSAFTLQLLHMSDADVSDSMTLKSVTGLSGLIARFRAEHPGNTLVLSAGDNYIPGPRFNAANDPAMNRLLGAAETGRADIAMLNAMGVQASALGNHELDLGPGQFAAIVKPAGAWRGAAFPYLAYNVDFSKDANTAGLAAPNGQTDAKGGVSGWSAIRLGQERIGVIGASSPVFPAITSTGRLGFTPPAAGGAFDIDALAARLQQGVDEMRATGIDKIVMLAHMQTISVETALAQKLDGVDIIVAGGSNTLLANAGNRLRAGDRAAGAYPLRFTSKSGEPVAVVNVDADYKYLGRFLAAFDRRGRLLPSSFDNPRNGPQITAATDEAAGAAPPVPEVAAIRDGIAAVIRAQDGNVLGRTAVFLEGRSDVVRNQETNFGNLAADADLWYARQADPRVQISLINSAAIRAEIGEIAIPPGETSAGAYRLLPPRANEDTGRREGEISQLALSTALKFNNKLWVGDVSAAALKELLEHGVAVLGSQGRFPQVAGMAFSYDPGATAQTLEKGTVATPGARIRSLRVGRDVVVRNGVLQGDPRRVFRLVTYAYLAGGGAGYPFPAALSGLLKLDEKLNETPGRTIGGSAGFAVPGTEQDALAKYLQSFYRDKPFNLADTEESGDLRIQNILRRADTVLVN